MRKLATYLLCLALLSPTVMSAKGSRGHSKTSTASKTKTNKKPIPCADGTTSHAEHRQGACSHHGGIKK